MLEDPGSDLAAVDPAHYAVVQGGRLAGKGRKLVVFGGMLELGTGWFATSKMLLTGSGILTLVFLAKTRFLNRLRTGLFLTIFFSGYCCLVCYQLVSLFNVL